MIKPAIASVRVHRFAQRGCYWSHIDERWMTMDRSVDLLFDSATPGASMERILRLAAGIFPGYMRCETETVNGTAFFNLKIDANCVPIDHRKLTGRIIRVEAVFKNKLTRDMVAAAILKRGRHKPLKSND